MLDADLDGDVVDLSSLSSSHPSFSSFRRKPESRLSNPGFHAGSWTPAFAGVTKEADGIVPKSVALRK